VDTSAPQFSQPGKVGQTAVYRRLVELEVARVDNQAHRRGDAQANAIGDRMAHAKKLDGERRKV